MSASTHPTSTLPEGGTFPGNSSLEMSLKIIVDVYHRYCILEGKDDDLSFKDFKTMLHEQAPTFLQACGRNRPNYLKQLFEETDVNKNKQVNFEEFTIVLAKLADDSHRIMHEDDRCTPDKD